MSLPIAGPDVSTQRPPPASPAPPRYLFLQGPIGSFFSLLARRLRQDGAAIHRLHFNGGDPVYWRVPGAVTQAYRDPLEQWMPTLNQHLSDWQITDLVLFGDCRPLHRAAIRLARMRGVAVHVFEEGYLRPDWITLESGGVNRHSSLPREASWYRETAARLGPETKPQAMTGSFVRRAAEDVLYTLNLSARQAAWRHYVTHKPWHPLVEYAAGARRFFAKPAMKRERDRRVAALLAAGAPYYLFPLQLDADAQIRFHSPFGTMTPAIRGVVASFARHAAADTRLVLTEHPLDNGVVDLRRAALAAAHAEGVADRVDFLHGGSPEPLLRGARGVVTVNSTLGLLALGFGRPVITLGDAFYDLAGLTHRGGLDAFWPQPQPPDAALYSDFRRVVLAHTQINGSYYSPQGRRLAVEGAARRLAAARARALAAPAAASPGPAATAHPDPQPSIGLG